MTTAIEAMLERSRFLREAKKVACRNACPYGLPKVSGNVGQFDGPLWRINVDKACQVPYVERVSKKLFQGWSIRMIIGKNVAVLDRPSGFGVD